ncbi:hypothetical protein [Paraflavitalea speifideaquila]|uniref:hypothetical protein n=1 Tax=Paraflavitalea speifideaquila TaxID=3076558 RepID=UPI0028E64B2F|nr:hypothetical protein [Paraflavitalea speifideiaquila]
MKIFYSWSAGLGLGAFAGGGLSASIYPLATMDQIMGDGFNFGANVGIPGISLGLDLNTSVQKDAITNQVTGIKLGTTMGYKVGSFGPGGAEVHVDYSSTTPIPGLEFNIKDIPQNVYDKIKKYVDMTDDQIKILYNTL